MPGKHTTPSADPLSDLLRRATAAAPDEDTRRWLRRILVQGEAASSTPAAPAAAPKVREVRRA